MQLNGIAKPLTVNIEHHRKTRQNDVDGENDSSYGNHSKRRFGAVVNDLV